MCVSCKGNKYHGLPLRRDPIPVDEALVYEALAFVRLTFMTKSGHNRAGSRTQLMS